MVVSYAERLGLLRGGWVEGGYEEAYVPGVTSEYPFEGGGGEMDL